MIDLLADPVQSPRLLRSDPVIERNVEIVLPDVEPASFLALLRFLYTDEVQIGPETVMTTLYTG